MSPDTRLCEKGVASLSPHSQRPQPCRAREGVVSKKEGHCC